MTAANSPLFSKPAEDPDRDVPTELSGVVTRLLADLPEPVDPSVIFDRLIETGLLRRWLDPLNGELVYLTTLKGQRLLEWLEHQPADPYPDTAESGETYDVEMESGR